MIIIIWSDHDGRNIEKFGEGRDGIKKAEARLLKLHNLEKSSDSNYGTTINMVIRGNEVQYEVGIEVASVVKIKNVQPRTQVA